MTNGCLALVPAGLAIDRSGAKPVMRRALQAGMLGLLLSASDPGFPVQLLARLVLGAALSTNFNASMALIMEHFQEPLRSKYLGSALGLGTLGNMVGPPAVGVIFDLAKSYNIPAPQALALVHPVLLLALVLHLLHSVEAQPKEPLLKQEQSPWKAFAVLSMGREALVLSLELVCTFAAHNAFTAAGALEMHRASYSSGAIGLTAVPAGLAQALSAWWAGAFAHSSLRRERLLLGTPFLLGALLLAVSLLVLRDSAWPVVPVVVFTLATTSAANGAVDAPSMSMMADLARARCLGFGQAVTCSEMAVSLGLALGPSVATALLKAPGGFGALCLVLGVWSLLSGAASGVQLRNVPHGEDGAATKTALPEGESCLSVAAKAGHRGRVERKILAKPGGQFRGREAPPKRRHDENLEPNRFGAVCTVLWDKVGIAWHWGPLPLEMPALTGKRARRPKANPRKLDQGSQPSDEPREQLCSNVIWPRFANLPRPVKANRSPSGQAALERKRRHQDMPASATQSEPQAQKAEEDMPASVPRSEPQAEKAEEDMPASVPRSEPQAEKAEEDLPASVPRSEPQAEKAEEDMPASVPRSEPQAQKAEKEEAAEESSSSSEDSSDEGTSSTSCTSQTSAGESGSDVEDEEPEEEAEEVDEEEEEAFEKEKEDEEKEEQEEKEEESEDENLPKVRGVCAPRGEPPCCTERWPAVQLQP
ncbi:unnamed protein product, partial [Effrenium voratum]